MGVKAQNATDSPKAEVGEIDTRAPFESVKAAVSLFGEGASVINRSTVKKPKPPPTERILAKETQLHLAKKELNKFKEQLKNAEIIRTQALAELEKAKRTIQDLTDKLNTINESKESAVKATEASRVQAKQLEAANSNNAAENGATWTSELNDAREKYTTTLSELDAAKQELRKIRQEFASTMDARASALQRVAEAEQMSEGSTERAGELSHEITVAHEALSHTKLACAQAEQENANIVSEREAYGVSAKASLEETKKKLEILRKEFDPVLVGNLETKLAATTAEISVLEKEIETIRGSQLDSLRDVTTGLDDAKETLKKLAEEETSLRNQVETLKLELENLKKEHSEAKEKEVETDTVAGNLHLKLRRSKAELEQALAGESRVQSKCGEMVTALQQLSSEANEAKREAEEMRKNAEELKGEAEATRFALVEAEKNLEVAMREAEAAKAAEARACDQVKALSEKTNAARSASSTESGAEITISHEEYEALSRKVEESDTLTEMKVAAAMAQVEAVKASENEAMKKLDVTRKEIEEMAKETEEALKRAEMADAAKRAVEGELRRWREREQKRAAEAAARILADANLSVEVDAKAPPAVKTQTPEKLDNGRNIKTQWPEKPDNGRKVERATTMKKSLLPSISGIFQRKKNQVEGGSPSYLPGEKPV